MALDFIVMPRACMIQHGHFSAEQGDQGNKSLLHDTGAIHEHKSTAVFKESKQTRSVVKHLLIIPAVKVSQLSNQSRMYEAV